MTVSRLIFPAIRWRDDTGFDHEWEAIGQALALGVGGFIIFGGPAESVLALTQRPATGAALGEPAAGTQAWHTIPAYYLISGADRIIPPAAQEFMAQRSGATTETVAGASHLVFVSNPATTVAFIEKAANENA